MTSLPRRMMAVVPQHVAYLKVNHRQQAGLHETPSELFYQGTMTTSHDEMDNIALQWHRFGAELVSDNLAKRKRRAIKEDKIADIFSGNRVTLICSGRQESVGTSPINRPQAFLTVYYAAMIHQSGIPGSNGQRPTICIITPYAAQKAVIKQALDQVSDREICRELIEVRAQNAATGGEWDIVINTFVRESSMGFLGDTWRLNVMMTRAILWNLDIVDRPLWDKPTGFGVHLIRKYRDDQRCNGAIMADLRNWSHCGICQRCFDRHDGSCNETLVCYVCGEGHHTRKCPSTAPMGPDIA